jgi:hypothetical protein
LFTPRRDHKENRHSRKGKILLNAEFCDLYNPLVLFFFFYYGSSGHGLPVARISRQLSFYKVRMSDPHPTPNLDSQGISLCPITSLKTCPA